jgi:hypothetical protein
VPPRHTEPLRSRSRSWETLLAGLCREAPPLAERLEGASALLDRPLAVPQHVAVNEEAEARGFANPRDHALIAGAH